MLTKALKYFCNDTTFNVNEKIKCGNFTILNRDKCYAIHYSQSNVFYEPKQKNYVLDLFNKTDPYFIHLWSKMEDGLKSKRKNLKGTAYEYLSSNYCPKISKTFTEYF